MQVHGLDNVVFEGLLLEDFGASGLELVGEVEGFWEFTEGGDDGTFEDCALLLHDHQVQGVTGHVVSVHTCFESSLDKSLGLFGLKQRDKKMSN